MDKVTKVVDDGKWKKWVYLSLAAFVVLNIYAGVKRIPLEGGNPLGAGAYGLAVADYIPAAGKKDVIFLGNSVHAGYQIVQLIQKRFDEANLPVQFGNFSHGGASVADYITHYRHVKQFEPDLLVLAFNPSSMGQDWPYFRNDSHKNILHPRYISLLKEKAVRDLISKEMYVESSFYSYVPICRWVEVAGLSIKRHLGIWTRDSKLTKMRIWNFFAIKPSLAFDMLTRRGKGKKTNEVIPDMGERKDKEYVNAKELLEVLIRDLKKDKQKTLFLIQPNSMPAGPTMKAMGDIVRGTDHFFFVDDSKFWDKTKYYDDVHPNAKGAEEDTYRQFKLINRLLNDK